MSVMNTWPLTPDLEPRSWSRYTNGIDLKFLHCFILELSNSISCMSTSTHQGYDNIQSTKTMKSRKEHSKVVTICTSYWFSIEIVTTESLTTGLNCHLHSPCSSYIHLPNDTHIFKPWMDKRFKPRSLLWSDRDN